MAEANGDNPWDSSGAYFSNWAANMWSGEKTPYSPEAAAIWAALEPLLSAPLTEEERLQVSADGMPRARIRARVGERKVIIKDFPVRHGLRNLKNIGECSLAIGGFKKDGGPIENIKARHVSLGPGENMDKYIPPPESYYLILMCFTDCRDECILEVDLPVA